MPAASYSSLGDVAALLAAVRPLPAPLMAEFAWSLLWAQPRSLAVDAQRAIDRLSPPLRMVGLEAVPARAPFLLVANHYQAPDLWIGWTAAAITAAVARARARGCRDLHWVILARWRWFQVAGRWIPNPLSTLLFPRAARVWGLIPMPSRPSDAAGRAGALRKILARLGQRGASTEITPAPVGLFPEGRASIALKTALPGTGAFLYRVSRLGVPLLPAAVYQEESLVVRFGSPFALSGPPGGDLDEGAAREVMVAIGRLLPREMWGAYSDAIQSAR